MKFSLHQHAWLKSGFLQLMCILVLLFFVGCQKGQKTPTVKVTTIASGLVNPMGMEVD